MPPEWGNAMDLLVSAHVLQPLSAWSGTPRTARSKDKDTQQYGDPWEPDRSITQLFLPGLNERRPDGALGPFYPVAKSAKTGCALLRLRRLRAIGESMKRNQPRGQS